jgi:type IX secretion system PorP/SprF family membrane protein
MKKVIFSLLLAAGFSTVADAQQDATYNMYMFNGLYINPAYAGSQDVLNVMGIFRNQWSGLDGAPRTVNASVDAPLRRDQYALGLTIMNDRLGLTNDFSATAAFAYRIKVKGPNVISLGVQGGFTYYQTRLTEAVLNDPNAQGQNTYDSKFSVNQNLLLPNIGAGIYAYGKRYFIGFSVPHLVPFSLDNKWQVATGSVVAHQYNQYLVTAGYVIGKDASIVKFRPSILLKAQKGTNYNMPDFTVNLGLLFIDRIWVIAGLNTGSTTASGAPQVFGASGIVGIIQAKITPQLGIGYSYEYSLRSFAAYETGTHEVMVNYLFWYNKKRFVTPRYVKYF